MAAAAQTAAVKKGNAERKKNAEKNKNWVAPDEGEGDEHSSFTPPIVDSVVPYVYPTTGFWKHQEACRNFYTDNRVVVFVAGLIVFNFFVSMTEKQIDPGPKPLMYNRTWFSFGLFFNICFTIELGINMYSFITDKKKDVDYFWTGASWSWNVFDFIVVSIGLLNYIEMALGDSMTMPAWLSKLRLMRAFRVFRLFKRVKSLNDIIKALGRAIPGMMNAFLIMLIVMCIYAILGVEFFKYYGTCKGPSAEDDVLYDDNANFPIGLDLLDDGEFDNCGGGGPSASSPQGIVLDSRGVPFGDAYFGNFGKSLYTLFQVLTGDSWSEAVGRPLMTYTPSSVIFFVSFILVNPVILINVVVAVLLEKMVADPEEMEEDEEPTAPPSSNDATALPPPPGTHTAEPHHPKPSGHGHNHKHSAEHHDHDARLKALEDNLLVVRDLLETLCKTQGVAVPQREGFVHGT